MYKDIVIKFKKPVELWKKEFDDLDDMLMYLLFKRFGVQLDSFSDKEIKVVEKLSWFKSFKTAVKCLKF
jgi:hypothetical protein